MRWKSCIFLPAASSRTQFFLLIFTEPGAHHKVHPCKSERRKAENPNNAGMDGSSLALFSIRFCRRKHNGLTLPGNVPFCEAYTIADWTPSQISISPRELACRSKELREWRRQNHCATCLLTCKNQKSRYVKVWHRSVLRCSVALVRFCRSDLHCLSPNLGDYLLAETGACHLKSSRQNFDIWAPMPICLCQAWIFRGF